MSQPGTDLTGRKVRLIGKSWDNLDAYPNRGAIRTIDRWSDTDEKWWAEDACSILEADGSDAYYGYEVELLPPRERVLVYVFADSDQAALDWVVPDRDPGSESFLRGRFNTDRYDGNHERGVFARLHVAGYAPDDAGRRRVDDLVTQLGDEILAGRLGKIIDRY